MGAAMICLAWMSSAVLYWAVSRFLARPVERKCYSAEQEDSLRPLFEAIVYSRSWVRKNVIGEVVIKINVGFTRLLVWRAGFLKELGHKSLRETEDYPPIAWLSTYRSRLIQTFICDVIWICDSTWYDQSRTGCGAKSISLWAHRNFFWQRPKDGKLHGSGSSRTHHDSLSKPILQGTLEGGRRRSRCWLDNVKEWTFRTMPELLTGQTTVNKWAPIRYIIPTNDRVHRPLQRCF